MTNTEAPTIHRTRTAARNAGGVNFCRGMKVRVLDRRGGVLATGRITGWGTQEMQLATPTGRRSLPNVLIGEVRSAARDF